MSLATRCPACGTTFRVVRDQLRISDGWVRCGRCSEVFDASEHLQALTAAGSLPPSAATPAVPAGVPHPRVEDALGQPLDGLPDDIDVAGPGDASALASDDVEDDPPWNDLAADEPWPNLPSLELGETPQRPAVWSTFKRPQPSPMEPVLLSSLQTLPHGRVAEGEGGVGEASAPALAATAAKLDEPSVVRTASESNDVAAPTEALRAADAAPRPSFLDAAPAAMRVEAPRRRRALQVVAFLALLLLVFQVLVQFRDTLVARQPALQPAFAAVCSLLHCELSALRRIDDISIDGSSFTRQRTEGGYLLNFTLRNRSTVPLAMPAVEISLLDTQERPVVRRVLMPAEFGAPALLAARGERSASLPLELKLSAAEIAALPAVAGYNLNAFYP